MTSRISKNLRKGHLSEDIGISFLRNFSAVAQVRQEDDVGIDAIATLLRPDGKLFYAEQSFTVQIKSVSVTEINYDEDQLEWLLNQDLPLFIMTVDKTEGKIAIFTTNPIYGLFTRNSKTATLHLDEEPKYHHQRIETDDSHADIYLGPPILVANELESRTDEFIDKAYSLLKSWVSSEINQIGFRRLKKSRLAKWETWEEPIYNGEVSSTSSKNIQRDMKAVKPYLEYLSNHVFWSPNKHKAASAFLTLKEWYEEKDVELYINKEVIEDKVI